MAALCEEIDRYVQMFGEEYRTLIVDALRFLEYREPQWKLPEPMNRTAFLRQVVSKVDRPQEVSDGGT